MERKVAFISCVNNEHIYGECVKYIENLLIPNGIKIELIPIRGAKSIMQGYNIGMKETDAKYKVYLHQDTFIINKNFINDMLDIFDIENNIGMLGVIGSKVLPTNAIWWEAKKKYGKVYNNLYGNMMLLEFDEIEDKYEKVQAIDGLIMITQHDIQWRTDIIDSWDFYNLSQCLEFIKEGYDVVIPRQEEPWCLRDCGILNIGENYERLRNVFIKEYNKDIIKTILKEIHNRHLDIYEYIIQWRKYYIEEIHDENMIKLIDEKLLNSLKVECENQNELFEFDKIKALEIMLNNKDQFDMYLRNAEIFLKSKNYEQAALWCFQGARFASEKHPGFYFSKELEDVLLECAVNLPNNYKAINLPQKNISKRNVLHVMSEGYSTGGHTRLVKNWIEKDKESTHSLATTWQLDSMPDWMIDEVKKSGGWIESLQNIDSFLDRAIALRNVAYEWADIIVLHIHMYDVIPIMAFGVDGGPPVVFMNHADHVFWIGSSISDLIINFREAGSDLTLRRRNSNKTSILPLPLSMKNYNENDENFRKSLGITENSIILLTIATPYKFQSFGSISYIDILNKVLQKYKNVIAIVVGPSKMGIWEEANKNTSNRLRPMGIQKDIHKHYLAADIYIDSYMIGSVTSALEAGVYEIPVAALQNYNNKTLSFNDSSYKINELRFNSLEKYVNYIGKLIEDIQYRKSQGKKLSLKVKENHVYKWNNYLQPIYFETKNREHKTFVRKIKKDTITNEDLFLAMFQESMYDK